MTSLALGLLSGGATLFALGWGRSFPWRIAGLVPPESSAPSLSSDRSTRRGPHRGPAAARDVRHLPRRRSAEPERIAAPRSDAAALVRCIDLLHLVVSSGRTLHEALRVAGRLGDGEAAGVCTAISERVDAGEPLLDATGELERRFGSAAAPLRAALAAALRSGTPAGPVLARLAERERLRARRRAESRVRRLPVLLLAPLVLLVLPSFVVLTVVPVGLTTARAARTVMDHDLPARGDLPSSPDDTPEDPP